MPLHLAPLSRRRFLGGSAVLAITSVFPDSTEAAESESWALISDTHIAADRSLISRQGVNMAGQLERVVAEIVAEKETLAGVILDGDCAYNEGQAGDYATLLEILDPLREAGLPVHFTLGNHDNREVFREAVGNRGEAGPVAGKYCSLLETPFANWILLDSLRFVNKVEGEFGAEQLAWAAKLLDAHPDKPTIVMAHHYPQSHRKAAAGEPVRVTGLVDSEPFLEMLSKRPSAKAYIYGHSHAWGVTRGEDGIHHVNLPTTAYVFAAENPIGWARATLSKGGMSLELRCLDPAHPRHGERHPLSWR